MISHLRQNMKTALRYDNVIFRRKEHKVLKWRCKIRSKLVLRTHEQEIGSTINLILDYFLP